MFSLYSTSAFCFAQIPNGFQWNLRDVNTTSNRWMRDRKFELTSKFCCHVANDFINFTVHRARCIHTCSSGGSIWPCIVFTSLVVTFSGPSNCVNSLAEYDIKTEFTNSPKWMWLQQLKEEERMSNCPLCITLCESFWTVLQSTKQTLDTLPP